jgi:hypothetical protein
LRKNELHISLVAIAQNLRRPPVLFAFANRWGEFRWMRRNPEQSKQKLRCGTFALP